MALIPLKRRDNRMKDKCTIRIIVTVLLTGAIVLFWLPLLVVFAEDVQPVGVPLSTTISFGDEYTNSVELYDAKITVLEIVRGSKAWDLIKKAAASNPKPKAGFEYLLARIRFEFSARSTPGDKTYALAESQFSAMSSAGKDYVAPNVPKLEPKLNGALRSGESLDGWIVLSVAEEDKKPILIFTEDVQTILRSGSGVRFRLY